ncbi:hypothetical protein BJ742DRAFT_819875 [Cladochytrium replicatum]|nr:hypothetical protein BJ742DRAFT_819875 [Cladochytrium replicatum]
MNLIFLALICIFGRTLGQPENPLKTELRNILIEMLDEISTQGKLRDAFQTDNSTVRESRLRSAEQHLANILNVKVGFTSPKLSDSLSLNAKRIRLDLWSTTSDNQKRLVFTDNEAMSSIEFSGRDTGFSTNFDGQLRPCIGGSSMNGAGLIIRMSNWTMGRVTGTDPNFMLEESSVKQSTWLSADPTKGLSWTNFGSLSATAVNLGSWSFAQTTTKELSFSENESKTAVNFKGSDSGFATNVDNTSPRPSIGGSGATGAGLIVRMADYAMGRIKGSDVNFGLEHSSLKQALWAETSGSGFKWNNFGSVPDINIGRATAQDIIINGKATIKEVSAVTGTVSQDLRIGTNWVMSEKNEQLEFVHSNGNRIKFSGKDLYYPDPDDKPQTRASISGDGDGRKEGGLNIHFGPQWKVVENYMSFQLELTNKYSLNTMLFSGYDRAAIETKKSGSVKLCCVN